MLQSLRDIPPSMRRPHQGQSLGSGQTYTRWSYNLRNELKFDGQILVDIHRLASQRIDNLFRVEILLAVNVLLEELAGSMSEEFVVRNL